MTEKEQKRKEYLKAYYQANKEKIKENSIASANANKDKLKEYQKEYRKSYKERDKNYHKEYYQKNKEKINEKNRDYIKQRKLIDPLFKITTNMRTSISQLIKKNGYLKPSNTEFILGCSFQTFKEHLESQFEDWMTWDNYGNWNGTPTEANMAWDIDHIIPTSSATTKDELIKLNHYTNLKPMCSYTNRWIKRNNIN